MKNRRPNTIGRASVLGLCVAAIIAQSQQAQAAEAAPATAATTPAAGAPLEEVIVTGFRKSLEDSTAAKREATGFVDAVFAEDMGKFPDTNIAESFNRIPGVTIQREITGEGLNIAIRGLGTNFTKVLLNNAPVAISSTGRTDAQSTNREVDLDLFPTELFSQLTVSKTPNASMLEGGAAGTVNMRSARPFDNPGQHLTYSLQGVDQNLADGTGARGSVVASGTWGAFGALVGVAGAHNKVRTTGYETIGWTNANQRSAATNFTTSAGNPLGYTDVDPATAGVQVSVGPTCTTACNGTGGGNWTIPGLVPVNAGNGLVTDTRIDGAFLLANNPGLTLQQIDNALIPRLGRPAEEFGDKDRYNAVVALEYRPTEDLHFYVDSMYGKKENDLRRIDMNWVGRNGSMIPLNMQVDENNVVTSGTFANAQAFLEYRPFIEDVEYYGANPGMTWQFTDKLSMDLQANYTKSTFHRESPTFLIQTPSNSGMTVTYENNGGIPSIVSSMDLNDPANFAWSGSRVNMQDEERETETKGIRGSLKFGDDALNVQVGGAWDEVSREINAYDNSQAWQNAVCGGNPNFLLPAPNSQPACNGDTGGGRPLYSDPRGFGRAGGISAGAPPLAYQGSLIPQSALTGYLQPGPSGYITVDWDRFARDANYDQFHAQTPIAASSNTGAAGGLVSEKTTGFFTELNGDTNLGESRLRYNVGLRWVRTDQTIGGILSIPDTRNPAPPVAPDNPSAYDGSLYPNTLTRQESDSTYENWLPSANAALNVSDNAVVRVGLSRTMTRANPNDMLPGLNFSGPSADAGNLGNSELDPYLSDNIDLGFEYYTGGAGYFGVAAFRKGLNGFTVIQSTTVPFTDLAQYGFTYDTINPTQQRAIDSRGGPNVATVVLNQRVNADGRLTVNGLEFNWVQPLDFLLSNIGLEGFGFTANYTIIDQKGEGAAPAVAVGVAPETYNATFYYENHGVSARISTTFAEGAEATTLNQNGIPLAAIYNDDYQQWDFSSSFDFSQIFGWSDFIPQLTVDVINLTEEKQRSYFQFSNAVFTEYDAGRTVIVGLRGRF